MKELDIILNGEASKTSLEEMKIKERARMKLKRTRAKYNKKTEEEGP